MRETRIQRDECGEKIALVLPYFGVLPNYFSYWLDSAGKNKRIDFLLFSDSDFSAFNVPLNVKIQHLGFSDIKERIQDILGFRVSLSHPYKLCDYKPLYGLVFARELVGYDYWGHCDSDVVWGDLDKFLKPGIIGNYDRLLSNGHLCLYRNKDNINRLVFSSPSWEHVGYRDIYRLPGSMAYDESDLLANSLASINGEQWDSDCFADVDFRVKQFVRTYKGKRMETFAYFRWENGSIYGVQPLNRGAEEREFAYLHLQKRDMAFTGLPLERCVITPTGFYDNSVVANTPLAEFVEPDPSWEAKWKRKVLANKLLNNAKGFALIKAKRRLLNR